MDAFSIEEKKERKQKAFVHFTKIGGSRLGKENVVVFIFKIPTDFPQDWGQDYS